MAAEPETYLRLACERDLLSLEPRPGMRDGFEAVIIGRALIAAGVLSKEVARRVLDEYAFAVVLRDHQRGRMLLRGQFHPQVHPQAVRQRLSAQRVVAGALEFEHGGQPWVLQRVLFADEGTHLDLVGAGPPTFGPMTRPNAAVAFPPGGVRPPPFPQTIALADDGGGTATGTVAGGSSWGGTSWQARFVSDHPLSADTGWIEVDGARIELPRSRPAPGARVEEIAPPDPVRAMLIGEILSTDRVHGNQDSFDIATRALVATGVLAKGDAVLEETRRIWGALASGTPAPGLPAPWDALLARFSRGDGREASMPIGTVIEDLEGYSIRFDALITQQGSFTLALAVSPGAPLLRHFPGMDLDTSPVTWWAEDDRGNTYVAFFSKGGGGPVADGEVHSLAPLDPKATELTLLPTTTHARGVVTVPLAALDEAP
jgi:hypothetical protein